MKFRYFLIIPFSFLIYFSFLILGSGFLLKTDLYPIIKYDNQKREVFFIDKKPRNWVSLKQVNPKLKKLILYSEDWSFYQHYGVDWRQVSQVLGESLEQGQLTRGASTISQQLVKNLYLNSSRSLFRKLNEFFLTLFMETICSKNWILERYLNIIELGNRIEGVSKASYYYFKKPQSKLSYKESAFITMLLPSPKKYSISFQKQKLTSFAEKRINEILDKLKLAKDKTEEEVNVLKAEKFSWENP